MDSDITHIDKNNITFECESCGASIQANDTERMAQCEYYGNRYMVPQELRAIQPRQFEPFERTVVINLGSANLGQTVYQQLPAATRSVPKRRGCGGVLVALFTFTLVLGTISGVVWAIVDQANPGFLSQILGTAFARRDLSFGGKGTGPGFFTNAVAIAVAIAVGTAGDVYVAERTSGRVQRFNKQGVYLNGWILADKEPIALTANKTTGNLYVVSGRNEYRYDGISGELLQTLPRERTGFFSTGDIALFANDDLLTYVSGVAGGSGVTGSSDDLVRLNSQGIELARGKNIISKVYGAVDPPAPWQVRLAADTGGNMFVLNKSLKPGAEVLVYNPDAKYVTRFGGVGSGQGQFSYPTDIAVDNKGRLYVSDSKGVLVFDHKGTYLNRISLRPGQSALGIDLTDSGALFVITSDQEVIEFVPK